VLHQLNVTSCETKGILFNEGRRSNQRLGLPDGKIGLHLDLQYYILSQTANIFHTGQRVNRARSSREPETQPDNFKCNIIYELALIYLTHYLNIYKTVYAFVCTYIYVCVCVCVCVCLLVCLFWARLIV